MSRKPTRKRASKVFCQNCKNKRRREFSLLLGGQKIHICKNCWIGFAYGMKQDWDIFDKSESAFREAVERTGQNEKDK